MVSFLIVGVGVVAAASTPILFAGATTAVILVSLSAALFPPATMISAIALAILFPATMASGSIAGIALIGGPIALSNATDKLWATSSADKTWTEIKDSSLEQLYRSNRIYTHNIKNYIEAGILTKESGNKMDKLLEQYREQKHIISRLPPSPFYIKLYGLSSLNFDDHKELVDSSTKKTDELLAPLSKDEMEVLNQLSNEDIEFFQSLSVIKSLSLKEQIEALRLSPSDMKKYANAKKQLLELEEEWKVEQEKIKQNPTGIVIPETS